MIRLDGIEIVYKKSQVSIDLEMREVKEKQEFLALVAHQARTYMGTEIEIQPEAKTDSVVVGLSDGREVHSARKRSTACSQASKR